MATAAQGMAGGASNFIGSLISLISKSDIRYQGFLATIDAEQATIALEKVRSWGTEGRLVQQGRPSSEELPPNENVYDSIVFRAADVKDLKIDDPNPQRNPPPPPPSQLPHDPAIMNSGAPGPFGAHYGRPPPPPPPGQGYPGPQFGNAPPPNVPYGAPGFPPYTRPPPPQNLQQPSQSEPKAEQVHKPTPAPTKPASNDAKATDKKDESSTDAVAEHLSKLNVAGAANLPSNAAKGKGDANGLTNKAHHNLPAIPRAAAAAAAAANGQERQSSRGRTVPGSGGRQRGPQSSVFDHPGGRRANGPVEVPDTDFDFAASNAKFSKQPKTNEEEGDEGEEGEEDSNVLSSIPPPSETKSFYDKSSFFDSISNEVTERQEGQQNRQQGGEELQGQFGGRGGGRGGRGGGRGRAERLAEERRNMATFGEVGSFGGGGPRGRGRGRGRGGRGRGGRGRGDGFRGGRGGQAATSAF